MNPFSKETLQKLFNALVVTMAFSAMCHMVLVMVVAVAQRNLSYINPLDFLGVSILLPQFRDSTVVTAAGWGVLVTLFFVILFIRARYHVYVAIMTDRMYDRVARLSERTNALRLRAHELGKEALQIDLRKIAHQAESIQAEVEAKLAARKTSKKPEKNTGRNK